MNERTCWVRWSSGEEEDKAILSTTRQSPNQSFAQWITICSFRNIKPLGTCHKQKLFHSFKTLFKASPWTVLLFPLGRLFFYRLHPLLGSNILECMTVGFKNSPALYTSQNGHHGKLYKQMLERVCRKGNPPIHLVGM